MQPADFSPPQARSAAIAVLLATALAALTLIAVPQARAATGLGEGDGVSYRLKKQKAKRHAHRSHRQRKSEATTVTVASTSQVSTQEAKPTRSGSSKPSKPSNPSSPTPVSEPAPAPTAPSTSTSADLLFLGDQTQDFWLNQSAPGAISEVADPAGGPEKVFKFTVGDSDLTQGSTPNPRGELITSPNITSGKEFWWSTKFFLPASFPAATPNFVTLMQGPYGTPNSGTPPFHIEANNGVIKWQRNATYNWDIPWQMPQVRNQWVTVMIHEKFASNGFVELWVNGQQVTFFSSGAYNPSHVAPTTRLEMKTMDSSNDGGANALYLQQYRKTGMYSSLTTYEGPLRIGATRASVGG